MARPSNWVLSACLSLALVAGLPSALAFRSGQISKALGAVESKVANETAQEVSRRIDLSTAVSVNMPIPQRDLQSAPFTTKDGKSGWVLRLPGNRPIATPAYDNGMLFVGGGYGSHEFYAVDSVID